MILTKLTSRTAAALRAGRVEWPYCIRRSLGECFDCSPEG